MLFPNSFYYLSWAFCSALVSLFSLSLFFWGVVTSISLIIDFSYSSFLCLDFSPCIVITPISSLFSFLVSVITFCVIIFSIYYMSSAVNTPYFVWLTVLFVISMLVTINFGDLFSVILGWDGLGVISFFLIVYYQSSVSVFSGLFTLFINRIGDGLLLGSIVSLFYCCPSSSFLLFSLSFIFSISLYLGLSTNSAIFPFSPWLPAAMAAPTPISSLVHSSTLVTAGLYLILRFSDFIYSFPLICTLICVCSVFTSLYAGLNSLVETDLKNVVALSTLSHLGFIGLAFSIGWNSLAFTHLGSHAVFNSLLFITLGSVITSLSHYQESRYLSSAFSVTPLSSGLIVVAVFSLLGFPFLSGFYSKDYILESIGFSSVSGWVSVVVYLNLLFTFSYAIRIFSSVTSFPNFNPLVQCLGYPPILGWSLGFLSILAVVMVSYLTGSSLLVLPLPVIALLNFYPPLLAVLLVITLLTLSGVHFYLPSFSLSFISTMLFLSNIWCNGASSLLKPLSSFVNNSFEYGVLNSTLNTSLFLGSSVLSSLITNLLSSLYFIICLLVLITILI